MATNIHNAGQKNSSLYGRHFWNCLFACSLILVSSKVFAASSSSLRGPPGPLHLAEESNLILKPQEANQEGAVVPSLPPTLESVESSPSGSSENEGDAIDANVPHQVQRALSAVAPGLVEPPFELSKSKKIGLTSLQRTNAGAGESEIFRSSKWEASTFSTITDDDLANNTVIEKVLRPADVLSIQLPRILSTSPKNLHSAGHPVVMGECDTGTTVHYTDLFKGVRPSYPFWAPQAEPGSGGKLVFAAPSEQVILKSGKNPQFCFKVFDPTKAGSVTFWIQVRANGLLPTCLDGNCQGAEPTTE